MARKRTKRPQTDDATPTVEETVEPAPTRTELAPAHARFGWTFLFVGMAFGLALEALLGFKAVAYLEDPLRRELWTLAHFHAALLSILNLVYTRFADEGLDVDRRLGASRSLIAGSILIPVGFLLGGVGHPEGDPSIGIFAVPLGALLLLYPIALHARAAWRR